MLRVNRKKSICLCIIAALILVMAPASRVSADAPEIRIQPGLLTIWTVPFLGGRGTYRGVVYDTDPPYLLNGVLFEAYAWDFCEVEDLGVFPFTFEIITPTGEIEIGLGVIGEADYRGYWPGYGYFLYNGDFYVTAVDPEGNVSFGYAPVFIIG
jgi:hypothetical protein